MMTDVFNKSIFRSFKRTGQVSFGMDFSLAILHHGSSLFWILVMLLQDSSLQTCQRESEWCWSWSSHLLCNADQTWWRHMPGKSFSQAKATFASFVTIKEMGDSFDVFGFSFFSCLRCIRGGPIAKKSHFEREEVELSALASYISYFHMLISNAFQHLSNYVKRFNWSS